MQIKKLAAFVLSTILCLQVLPALSLATEQTAPLVKTPGYQDFPTYYSDIHHADGQVTHPDVVVMDEAWNGYRYWTVYTPNVMGISIYENPSIVASLDGVTWVEPTGLTNPIDPQPPSTRYHNCDADMIYNPKMDAMMAYWNWADDQAGGVGAEARLRISYDGIHWGIPVTYHSATREWTAPANAEERQVTSGPQDYITVISSGARYDMLSPTFVYDSYRDSFIMWANNTGDVGYNNGQNNYVRMWYSKDGISWGDPVRVNNFLGLNANGNQLAPWHQDIQYISELREFVAVSQCFAGNSPDGSVLHLTKSKDGVNWQQVGTRPLLSPGADGSWDDFQIYRSSFYYEPGATVGGGTMRVWYSALQKNTANQMVPDAQGNLTIQAKDQDSRIWRIGYAENNYVGIMRVLLEDPDDTVPPLVAGISLTLTSGTQTDAMPMGEKAQLQAVFQPASTSDQVVKYTSSHPGVATVDDYGVVTAVSTGTASITGQTAEGLSASVSFDVVANGDRLIPQSSMTASATSVYAGTAEGPAANVLDGNTATLWHTNYAPVDLLPQSLTVSFGQTRNISKYVYTPRQSGTNGMVTLYELYALKADGTKVLMADGTWIIDSTDKSITFDPVEAVGMELNVLAGHDGFGTAAEINVYEFADAEPEFILVDDRDTSLRYTGTWENDSDPAFHNSTARHTNSDEASVEFAFTGTAIRWYGQRDTNFGTASVYIDDALVEEVNVNGVMATGQLLFEQTGLADGAHTIHVVRTSATIDLDYFSYTN